MNDNTHDINQLLRDSAREITERMTIAARLNVHTELPFMLADVTRYLTDGNSALDGWLLLCRCEVVLHDAMDAILNAAGFYDEMRAWHTQYEQRSAAHE